MSKRILVVENQPDSRQIIVLIDFAAKGITTIGPVEFTEHAREANPEFPDIYAVLASAASYRNVRLDALMMGQSPRIVGNGRSAIAGDLGCERGRATARQLR
jgi:hypothetical protein